MIVVDASVLTDVLLGRPRAVEALGREMTAKDHEWLYAPDLIELEILNALRRLVSTRRVTERRATEALRDLAEVRLARFAHAPLRARVWELRHNLTAYDAAYVALAEAHDESVLLTSDKALAREARMALGADRVRLVG